MTSYPALPPPSWSDASQASLVVAVHWLAIHFRLRHVSQVDEARRPDRPSLSPPFLAACLLTGQLCQKREAGAWHIDTNGNALFAWHWPASASNDVPEEPIMAPERAPRSRLRSIKSCVSERDCLSLHPVSLFKREPASQTAAANVYLAENYRLLPCVRQHGHAAVSWLFRAPREVGHVTATQRIWSCRPGERSPFPACIERSAPILRPLGRQAAP
jgi:hypothetical protein